MIERVELRDLLDGDLPIVFMFQQDARANYMAAFTAKDPTDALAFCAHWDRIRANPGIAIKTVLADGAVAGTVLAFEIEGEREISYWLGREYWGRGIATAALGRFLALVTQRPLFARAASDNVGSIRVLKKCGFRIVREERGFANARGIEIAEVILRLDAGANRFT
ncbi:MAG: GNAT family N-acetyltransferase [Candidatus Velthaea sp.]